MAKDNKFLNLLEKYQSRFEQKGFLVGDVFKFNDNFKSHEHYKALPANVKDLLDSYIDSGLHIRVAGVEDDAEHIVVAQDHGGGRMVGKVTIPCCLGEPVDFGDNLAPIPEVQKRHDKVNIKPVEVEENKENLSNKTDRGDGKLTQTDLTLKKESYVADLYLPE